MLEVKIWIYTLKVIHKLKDKLIKQRYLTDYNLIKRKIPENEARAQAIIYALARARKSSGRLNLDDIERAAETLNIYNDSSQAILTKLKVVEQELIAAHQVQADLLKRNFPTDASNLAKERGGSLSYIVDGNIYW